MCKRVESIYRQDVKFSVGRCNGFVGLRATDKVLYVFMVTFLFSCFTLCRYGMYLDVLCSAVGSMITQSPLFHGPLMVGQLAFFCV